MTDYLLLSPVVLVILLSFIVIVAGLFLKEKRVLGYLTITGLLAAFFITLANFDARATLFSNSIVIDPFGQFFNLLFLVVSLVVCLASLEYYGNHPNQDEYYTLLLLATAGMMLVSFSNDLIILFVSFELVSLPTYLLAGFDKKNPRSMEASLKYFIIGALSAGILLFGISFIYGATGETNLETILNSNLLEQSSIAVLGTILILVGFGFKMALVPFHMWAPDTYQGAPSVVSAFLSAGSKTVGFVAAFRVFLLALLALKFQWYLAFAILAVATMTLGNVVAIAQNSIKRMLAYSSVAHAGYVIIAFVVIAHSPEAAQFALTGGVLHALSHALGKAGAFVVVALVAHMVVGRGEEGPEGDSLENYNGLGKRAPLTALLMTVLLLSLAGIPPTFGFYTKFVLFLSAIQGGLLWLALIAILNSALSVYYYARVVMRMYWMEPQGGKVHEPWFYVLAVLLAVAGIVVLGLYPEPVYRMALEAAGALLSTSPP